MIKYLLCVGVGVGVGFYIARERYEERYSSLLAESTEQAEEFFRKKYRKEAVESVQEAGFTEAVIDAAEALQEYSGIETIPVVLAQDIEQVIKTASAEGRLDVEQLEKDLAEYKELTAEESLKPPKTESGQVRYDKVATPAKAEGPKKADLQEVIGEDEYIDNETEYKQFSITYYAGDDVLAGESDQVIDHETRVNTLGNDVLEMLRMPDTRVLYVRNHQEQVEVDISISRGKYVDEVGPIDNTG